MRYATVLTPDPKLESALRKAVAAAPADWPVAVAVVALNADGSRPVAHHRGSEVHFSASLLKVAAMYSAFELRRALRDVAQELGESTSQSALLKQAADHLNPQILEQAGRLTALKGIGSEVLIPRYASVFDVTPFSSGGFDVNFNSEFSGHLEKMIAISINTSAGTCIRGSGYGYLNGALTTAGFFDASTTTGIWLAGDYVGVYPSVRIPSVNDGGAAQAATVLQLARLFTLIHDQTLVGGMSSLDMLDLLAKAVAAGEVFISRASALDFDVTHTKVGLGPLKSGKSVWSETSIVKHDTGPQFVVAWQNLQDGDFDSVGHVVNAAINAYLAH